MDEDLDLIEESNKTKDAILKLLIKTVKDLRTDYEERDEWLRKPTSEAPALTRKLDNRKISTMMSAETEIQRKGQKKMLTAQTRNKIKDVKERYSLIGEKTERKMRKAYNSDLKNNPYYLGLSKKLLAGAEYEFEERLQKELRHVKRDCEREIQEIISLQPILRKKGAGSLPKTTNHRQDSKRVTKIRAKHSEEIKEFMLTLDEYEKQEKAIFEENFGAGSEDDADKEEAREANLVAIEKEKVRRTIEFNSRITCETRMAEGKSLERQMMYEPIFDRDLLEEMMNVYISEANNTTMFPRQNRSWEDIVILIDRLFGCRPSWKDFVVKACTAWSNTGDKDLRSELDKRMKRYALLLLDGYFEDVDECNPYYTEKDIEIGKLRVEREELIRKIIVMDEIIVEKLRQTKREVDFAKSRSMKNRKVQQKQSSSDEEAIPSNSVISSKDILEKIRKYEEKEAKLIEANKKKKRREEEKELNAYYDKYS